MQRDVHEVEEPMRSSEQGLFQFALWSFILITCVTTYAMLTIMGS
jgi:hypothetical protein